MNVRTDIYLEATQFLSDLEDQDEKFSLLHRGLNFSNTDAVGEAVERVTGEEIEIDEKRAIDSCISGIVLPHHHDRSFETLENVEEEFGEELGQLIRDIAFTFVTAWTHRYGGFFGQLRADRSGMLIDPTRIND